MYPALQMPSDFMSLFSLHWTAGQQVFGHLPALSRGVTISQVHSNTVSHRYVSTWILSFILHLTAAAGDERHPHTFLPVPLLLPGPGKTQLL